MHPSRTHNALELPGRITPKSKVSLYQEIAPKFRSLFEGAREPFIGFRQRRDSGSKFRDRYVFIPKLDPRSFFNRAEAALNTRRNSARRKYALVVRLVTSLSLWAWATTPRTASSPALR